MIPSEKPAKLSRIEEGSQDEEKEKEVRTLSEPATRQSGASAFDDPEGELIEEGSKKKNFGSSKAQNLRKLPNCQRLKENRERGAMGLKESG